MELTLSPNQAYVNGGTVDYLSVGDGPPMLLLDGSGTSSISWRHNLEPLSKFFTLYAPNLPGIGNSQTPFLYPHNLSECAEIVYGFMAALGIDRAHLVGLSLGGAIADLVSQRHPERVHRLVLISNLGLRGIARSGLSRQFQEKQRESLRAADSENIRALEEQSLMNQPLLIITGERDAKIRCEAVSYVVARNPLAKWVIIPDGQHLLQEEHPEAVNRSIISYCIETPVNAFCG